MIDVASKFIAPSNMDAIFITNAVFHGTSPANDSANANILDISSTPAVSNPETAPLKFVAPSNILFINMTLFVSQPILVPSFKS